jgi:hypothetical protein
LVVAYDTEPADLALSAQEPDEEVDPSTLYWPARPAELLIDELERKERRYFEFVAQQGFGDAWLGAYCAYYGRDPETLAWESQSVGFDGERGEFLRYRINEFRAYLRQSTGMALGQRPAFQAIARSDDYESLAQVESADTAINSIYESRYGERKERATVEKGDLFGQSWTVTTFDPDGGEEIEVEIPMPPEAGGGASPATEKIRAGEIIIKSRAPWEVYFEPTIEDFDDHVWRCEKDRVSKHEIAARYPELRDRILELQDNDPYQIDRLFGFIEVGGLKTDEVTVRHFYHARTRALPQGRYLVFVGKLPLYDGPIPYRRLPFTDYTPSQYINTALGYADSWDMVPIGQLLDQIVADATSNIAAFGRQTVFIPEGAEWTEEDLANGMRVLTVPPGTEPPQAVNLAALPQGIEWIVQLLEAKFQSISGLNATSRGQSDPNVTSGTMAALFHSIAIEVNCAKQLAVDAHRERVANQILDLCKDFVQHPMLAEIVGADERTYLQSFDASVFKSVPKVTIKTANPMVRSTAGRLELAQMLLKVPNAVSTPQQIIEVLVSGQLKPIYKAPRSEMLRISWENEALAEGPDTTQLPDQENPINPDGTPRFYETVPTVPVLATDNPQKHILEHLGMRFTEPCSSARVGRTG